ncbi:hypothetical protein CWIS_13750 [Cellulomonas sp. A375-1]|uniref:hypothetical protein n=1 Tax=Cellulomonas sp. A375-1 TaxID=1672219 RepID=UPI00065267E9|nr:hypothetical protein [Cellulomonas sp. A375-1]KMM44881.1 hypothetical protein CWIS_13750 [Cellulomonas sp. A375-1]
MSTTRAQASATSVVTVTFDRIGRSSDVPPLPVELNVQAPNAADLLAEAVWRYAGKFLVSRDYAVDLDLTTGRGNIGWGRFGSFTFPAVTR